MLKGRIYHINSTKYLVDANNKEYDCVLRGVFRQKKITPFVGDYVEIDEKKLQIINVLPRKNQLIRPNIANVDIAVIMTSVKKPELDLVLLDKLLVQIINNDVKPIICFSKVDLLDEAKLDDFLKIKDYYESIGIKTIINNDIDTFNKLVSKKVIVICGQTGAGKSSFINKLDASKNLATDNISESLGRGKHTTRYVSLYKIKDYYIADTPGFSFLDITSFSVEQIKNAFLEFANFPCKYRDCLHINVDGCKVSINAGKSILLSRYENYQKFIKERNESSRKLFK